MSHILRTTATLYRIKRSLWFFGRIGELLAALVVLIAVPLVLTYMQIGLVPQFSIAILVTRLMILAAFNLFAGLILDMVVRGQREVKRLAYLALLAPPAV